MTPLTDGISGYLILLAISLFAHEPWRWLGIVLARNLSIESEIFVWVRAVATALVAGLVTRLILFPAGVLADVPTTLRLTCFAGAIGLFFATGRNLGVGIIGGAALLVIMRKFSGG